MGDIGTCAAQSSYPDHLKSHRPNCQIKPNKKIVIAVRQSGSQICAAVAYMDRRRDGNDSAGNLVFLAPGLATDVLE